MRRRYRYDAAADMLYEVGSNYFEEKGHAPGVISDDLGFGVNGLKHMPSGQMLDSKSAHRAETKRRGLVEIGNDEGFPQKAKPHPDDYMREALKARDQIEGNWNGTADWLQRSKEQERR